MSALLTRVPVETWIARGPLLLLAGFGGATRRVAFLAVMLLLSGSRIGVEPIECTLDESGTSMMGGYHGIPTDLEKFGKKPSREAVRRQIRSATQAGFGETFGNPPSACNSRFRREAFDKREGGVQVFQERSCTLCTPFE